MSGTCYLCVATRQIHSREIVEVFKMWVKHSEQYDPRTIALQREASLADGLLTLGFKSLQIADFQNQECYYAGFFNMTIALERVCKLAIQSDAYKEKGQFLTDGELKNEYGHKLNELYGKISQIIERHGNTVEKPKNTQEIEKMLNFLTDFAKRSRYYNLTSLQQAKGNSEPIKQWFKIALRHQQSDLPSMELRQENENQEPDDGEEDELHDAWFFREDGQSISSPADMKNALTRSFHAQLEGLTICYRICQYLIRGLLLFSEACSPSDQAILDKQSCDKNGSLEKMLRRAEERGNIFYLPNYEEFFEYFSRTDNEFHKECEECLRIIYQGKYSSCRS